MSCMNFCTPGYLNTGEKRVEHISCLSGHSGSKEERESRDAAPKKAPLHLESKGKNHVCLPE